MAKFFPSFQLDWLSISFSYSKFHWEEHWIQWFIKPIQLPCFKKSPLIDASQALISTELYSTGASFPPFTSTDELVQNSEHVSKDGKAKNSKIMTFGNDTQIKLSKHVHSFIHLLRSNLFTELRQNWVCKMHF